MGESILVPTVNNVTNNKINITNNISPSSSSPPPMAPNQNNAVALRCPRCDSSNTKFCYYNNYSLTQPRHFCKACKRYWTRGGTLRNVPVGGGCRKNKRHKRSASASAAVAATAVSADPAKSSSLFSALAANNNNNSSENLNLNSFLFGLPSAAASTSGMNQYVSYELQPQMSTLGIGGSDNNQFQLGFDNNQFLNDYSLLPYQDLQASASENFRLQREVKIEAGSNVTEPWQIPYMMNPLEVLAGSDYSYPYWNSAAVGSAGWPDVKSSSIAQLF